MNAFLESLTAWLVDFLVLATALLIGALLLRHAFRQPTRRVALAWGTWLGVATLAVLTALPTWPRYEIGNIADRWQSLSAAISARKAETISHLDESCADVAPNSTPTLISNLQYLLRTKSQPNAVESANIATALAAAWLAVGILSI